MKNLILIIFLVLTGCKAALKSGDSSSFDKNHNPYEQIPGRFTANAGDATTTSIRLWWGDSIRADSYTVKYQDISSSNWIIVSSDATSPFMINSLQSNTSYRFMITANNRTGSVDSNIITFTTQAHVLTVVAGNVQAPSFNEDTESIITLPYASPDSSLASACEVSSLVNVTETRSCLCDNAGVCTVGVTGTYHYSGAGSFSYRVMKGAGYSNIDTVSFNILPVNYPPTISPIAAVTTSEDTATTISLTVNDTDSPIACNSTYLTATSTNVSMVPVSSITFGGTIPNCTASFTPALDTSGTTDITISVTDGINTITSNVISVTVNAVDDAPVIGTINAVATTEDVSKNVNFTISDVDSTLSCTGSTSITSANSALISASGVTFSGSAPNCAMTITPNLHQYGSTTLTLSVNDGVTTVQKSFSIDVAQINYAPTMSFISNSSTNEDVPAVLNFTISDVESPLACNASYLSAASSDPTVVLSTDIVFGGTAPNCTATITALPNKSGSTNITFTVTDGALSLTSNAFTLTANAVNDAPTISTVLTPQLTNQDVAKVVNFTINDIDSTLACADVSGNSDNQSLVANAGIVIGGTFPNCTATVTPLTAQTGNVNISLTVSDGSLTATSSFSLVIIPVNGAPSISAISNTTTNEDAPVVVNFTINDPDSTLNCTPSNLSLNSDNQTLVSSSSATFSGTYPNCSASIVPATDVSGTANLNIIVSDGTDTTTSNTFSVSVAAVNDAPTISTILPQSINQDTVNAVNFNINDIDSTITCAGNVTAISSDASIVDPSGIVITGTYPDCTATVTPVTGKHGTLSITLTVTDGSLSASSSYNLAIAAVNAAPTISFISNQTSNEDSPATVNFTIGDVDSVIDCSASYLSASSSNPTLVLGTDVVFSGTYPNCTATITPLSNQNGTTNFTISATDGSLTTVSNAFSLTVNAVNDAPTISSIAHQSINQDTVDTVNFTISDVDSTLSCNGNVTGSSSNTSIVANAGIVISGTYPNCTATVTPTAGKSGTLNISLVVSDGSLSNTSTYSLNINAVNAAPTISTISNVATNEDTNGVLNFTINDDDSSLDCNSSYLSAASTNSALINSSTIVFGGTYPNCTATFSPVADQSGTASLNIIVNDGSLTTTSNSVTVTVNAVNDAPVISSMPTQNLALNQGTTVNFTITDVDSTLSCSGSMAVTSSDLTILPISNIVFSGSAPNCSASITPVHNQSGNVSLTFTTSDGTLSASSSFAVTFNSSYVPPVASNLSPSSFSEDTEAMVTLSYTNVQSDLATSCYIASTTNVSVTTPCVCDGAGICQVGVTGLQNYNGAAAFTYNVTANNTASNTATATLVITPVNDAPVISTIPAQSTNEDTSKAINFTVSDIDSTLTCAGSVTASSTNTSLLDTANISISGTAPNCIATVLPKANQNGHTNITFSVTDGSLSAQTTFAFTVNAVNDAPVMGAISSQTTNEDTSLVVNFTINDIDSTLSCYGNLTANSGTPALVNSSEIVFGGSYPNCTATITPEPNQNGTVSLSFIVNDGSLSDTKTFNLTITPVNDAPTISTIAAQSTFEDTAKSVSFTINDIDSTLTCAGNVTASSSNSGLIDPSNITFSGTVPNCTASITPDFDQYGNSNLTFTVSDGNLSAQSTFSLTVNAVNDAPVISTIASQVTLEDTPKNVSFTINDTDSTLSCSGSVTATSNNASLIDPAHVIISGTAPNCIATFNPLADQNGSTLITLTVTDGSLTDQKSFTLNVTAVNDSPVISTIAVQTTNEDTAKVVTFTISDVDSTLSCANSVSATSSNSSLINPAAITFAGSAPNCTATITPIADQNGSSNLIFTVTDGSLSEQSAFTFNVTAVNDAPTMGVIAAQSAVEDTVKIINFTINDLDSVISCNGSITAASSNSSLVNASSGIIFGGTYPDCTATITSVADQNGTVNLSFIVSDGALSATRTFSYTIAAVNDAPVIGTIAAQSTSEDVIKTVNFTISDVDSTLTCAGSVSASSSNSALVGLSGIVITGTAPNCVATISPLLYQFGTSNITLTVNDGSLSSHTSFLLTVSAVNNAPTISYMLNAVTDEDTSKVINFTIADVDSTMACSSSYLSAVSSSASVVLSTDITFGGTYPNCTATISPLANQNGSTNITISVTDGFLTTTSNAFSFTVNPVNDAPVISTIIAQSTNEDTSKVINFTISDIDSTLTCAGSMSASSSNSAIVPSTSVTFSGTAPNCTATVVPAPDANGTLNLTFTASDGSLTSSSTFALTVVSVNDAPTIATITSKVTDEDTALVVNFSIADIDSTLSCVGSMNATASNVSVVFSGTFPSCKATLTPAANVNGGPFNITFTVSDGALTAATTFGLTINPVDDAPVTTNITSVTASEDIQAIITLPYIDVDGDQASSCNVSSLSNITITRACACTSGVCTVGVTGSQDYNGSAGFSFNVTANNSVSNTSTANFSISAVNDAPTMAAISATGTVEDTAVSVNFTIADIDSTLTCAGSVSASSSNTTKIPNANVVITGTAPNCTVFITPAATQNGTTNITLTVSDGSLTASRTFAVTVQPVLNIGGSLTLSGVADTTYSRTISFASLTVDEPVSKAEVCISEDVNLDGSISAGEKCNTQTWIDITAAIGASGSSTPASWSNYTVTQGVNGASFTQPLMVTCVSNRMYVTHIRLTNSASSKTEIASASWKFWNPTCITAQVGAWLDASDYSTIYANATCTGAQATPGAAAGVKCWKDKSTNAIGYNGSTTAYPKYSSNAWSNGKPAVVFEGAQDIFKNSVNLYPKNILAVSKINSNVNNMGLVSSFGTDYGIRMNASGSWYSSNSSSDFTVTGGLSYVNGTAGTAHNLAEHLLYQTKGDSILPLLGLWGGFSIGGNTLNASRISANIAEIIVCTTDCSASQTKLEGYLAHKWGLNGNLPANHPYKVTPP